MASVNKVILVGNLGADPETRCMPNGNAACNITVATSETWKDKSTGENKESTEWHRCVMFGKLAEIAEKYLKKGSSVYLEGKITTRKWQDKEGQDRYTTELVMHNMQMLGGKPEGSQSSNGGGGNDAGRAPEKKKTPSFEDMDDDISFVSCSFFDDATARKALK